MRTWECRELTGLALTPSELGAALLDRLHLPTDDELLATAEIGIATLDAALAHHSPELLADYLLFSARRIEVLTGRRVLAEDVRALPGHLLDDELAPESVARVTAFLERALEVAEDWARTDPPPPARRELGERARHYLDEVLAGHREAAVAVVVEAADAGVDLAELLTDVLEAAQLEIGRLWEEGQISVAQEHYCTAITQLAMAGLYPRLFTGAPARGRPRLVAVQTPGSLHEVGLRMVVDLLEHDGWATTYLGAEPDPSRIVAALLDGGADVLAISASMAAQVGAAAALIRAVRGDPRTARVRILVGGRPFLVAPALGEEIGADATARDARDALAQCARWRTAVSDVAAL
jgi:methanogenic corrinoid protein MtbC1